MMLKVAVVLLVLVVLSGAEARRRGGGGGGGGRQRGQRGGSRVKGLPPNAQIISVWMRTLTSSTAQEAAYTVPDQNDQVYIMSKDGRQLKRDDYKASKTLYDFTGGSSVVVMKIKKMKGCVLLDKPTNLRKDAVIQQATALNGTTVPASTPVNMYLSDEALSPAQASSMQGRAAITAMCGRKPVKALTATAPASTDGASTVLTTTLGDQLSISIPAGNGGRAGSRVRGGGGGRPPRGGRRNNPAA